MMLLALMLMAGEETYYLGHAPKYANVVFESQGDLETIIGTTNDVSGTIVVDREKGTGSVSIKVPVKSLKTGVEMRDGHLQGPHWFDAVKNPDITFVSRKVRMVENAKNKVEVTGDFTMHGVTRELVAVVEWRDLPEAGTKKNHFPDGKWIRFATEFKVKLSDHGMNVPDMAKDEVSDTISVKMVLFAGTGKPEKK